eukprot:3068142-Rhodomonas_salina.2
MSRSLRSRMIRVLCMMPCCVKSAMVHPRHVNSHLASGTQAQRRERKERKIDASLQQSLQRSSTVVNGRQRSSSTDVLVAEAGGDAVDAQPVSYTHLRAHETEADL